MRGKRTALFVAALNALLVSAQSPKQEADAIERYIAEHPYSAEFEFLFEEEE